MPATQTVQPVSSRPASGRAAVLRRRRLRIALVVHDYNRVLGHSRYVVELAERFAAQHEVHVFANTFEQLPPTIVGHHVPALRTWALSTIFSFVLPASFMVGRGFDIVHAQGLVVFRPDVVTAHISNARWIEGRRLLEGGKLPLRERLFSALVIPAERRTMRDRGATVIAVSSALGNDLVRDYGRAAETVVIPHGVDQRQFHPDVRTRFREMVRLETGIPERVPVFLYVGDFRKGFEQAVRAMTAVDGGHLIGISRTPSERYRSLANECGVSDRVTMLPPTRTIERYYGAADALVLPTPYDAFGMVITEAMSCGLPVITTPLAGAAELITHNVNGLLVRCPNDVDGLSAAMRLLATDSSIRDRMGAAAARLMCEHTWDRVAERTLRVYDDHLGRRTSHLSATGVRCA